MEELESWINDQEIVAQSKELGHDFEHCEVHFVFITWLIILCARVLYCI